MRKRFLSILLTLTLLPALAGCGAQDAPVLFYYLRDKFVYGAEDGVIAAEEREIDTDRDLNYLLRLYLEGPLSDSFTSPFPRGLYLLSSQLENGTLTVILSEEFGHLNEMDLTLAAGCLASTCFSLTNAQQVQIHFKTSEGGMNLVVSRDSFILLDNSAVTATEIPAE